MFFFFRIVGKGIPSEQYQIKNVPKKSKSYKGFKFNEGGRISNASSAISDISTVTLTEDSMKTEFAQDDDEEEIIGKGVIHKLRRQVRGRALWRHYNIATFKK